MNQIEADVLQEVMPPAPLMPGQGWHCPVFAVDGDGCILSMNPSMLDLCGLSAQAVLGQDIRRWVAAWRVDSAWQAALAASAKGTALGTVVWGEAGGPERWLDLSGLGCALGSSAPDTRVFLATDLTAQRQAQTDLQETHERLCFALEGGNDGLWDWLDTHSQDMWWSPEFYRLLGYEASELEASLVSFDGLLHPDDQARTFEALAAALDADIPYRVEFRLLTKQAGYRWYRSRAKVLRDPGGEHRRMAGSLQDIDDLKRSQERLDLALEGANQALWDWLDTHSQSMWWSNQFYRLLGLSPGEISADLAAFDTLVHPEDQASYFEALGAALDDAPTLEVEVRLMTRHAGYRWFKMAGKVFRDGQQQHSRIAGAMTDIDDAKQIQAEVRRRQEELGAIAAISPDGFFSFDQDDRLRFVSEAVHQLTGLEGAAWKGRSLREVLAALQAGSTEPGVVIELGELKRAPLYLTMAQTPPRPLELAWHCATSANGEQANLLQLRDLTVEQEAEQIKSDFLTLAAHELRTPLASIFGYTELLLNYDMPANRQKGMLATVYRQCEVLMSIVNELIDLARLDAQEGSPTTLQRVDLNEVVSQAVTSFGPPAERQAPELVLHGRELWAQVDKEPFLHALRNLLSNAYKYSEVDRPVRVETWQAQDSQGRAQIGVTVIDQGQGMDAEQLKRAPERFWRADKSGHVPGAGLGLSYAQQAMAQMGGELRMASEPGRGSTISLCLGAC